MWRAAAIIDDVFREIRVIPLEGEAFSTDRVYSAAYNLKSFPIHHLDNEKRNSDTRRDAIELWSTRLATDANQFDWAGPTKIRKVESAIALDFESSREAGAPLPGPTTLAWHDKTAVIIPISAKATNIIVEYQPSLRDENEIARFRRLYASPEHTLETILDWRGYFGKEFAVVDGWTTMRSGGHGYTASVIGTVGYVVGTVVRRLTRSQPTLERDPHVSGRLIELSERYPHIANGCPDLSRISPIELECAVVFVHGMFSCGILGLKDLYPAPTAPQNIFRYEHDTFRRLDENASELAELIHNRIRTKKLLIAAHSRGGLVARFAVANLLQRGFGGQIEVFTFGTPHLGTPLVEVGGKALNLIYKLGEDFVGSIPYMTPLAKAYSYLFDAPTLPPGIAAMGENSDAIGILRLVGNADRVRSYGSRFDIETAPSGFGVIVEGALLGAFGKRSHDLLVPTESALGFGRPQPALTCSHVHYFQEQTVENDITQYCPKPTTSPEYVTIGDIRAVAANDAASKNKDKGVPEAPDPEKSPKPEERQQPTKGQGGARGEKD